MCAQYINTLIYLLIEDFMAPQIEKKIRKIFGSPYFHDLQGVTRSRLCFYAHARSHLT